MNPIELSTITLPFKRTYINHLNRIFNKPSDRTLTLIFNFNKTLPITYITKAIYTYNNFLYITLLNTT